MSDWITVEDKFYTSTISGVFGPIIYGVEYNYKTGEYQLKEQSSLGGSSILYKNGEWSSDALRDKNLFVDGDPKKETQAAKELAEKVKKVSYAAFQTIGGAQKGYVINDSARPANQNSPSPVSGSTDPGTSPPSIAPPLPKEFQEIINAITEPGFEKLEKVINESFKSSNEDTLFKGIIKYPFDILENQQDTLRIQMFNYQAPYGESFLKNPNFREIAISGLKRNSALKKLLGTVILPIPSGIQDSNSINWGSGDMNSLTSAVTSMVAQNPGQNVAGQLLANFGGSVAGSKGLPLPVQSLINAIMLFNAGGASSPLLKPAIVSLLLKSGGFEVSPETILSRGFGVVPNSNMELLFNGPTLREFQFNWRMSPRSESEAENVRRIIRFFKQGSAPRKANPNNSSANSLLLGTPNVFKLRYVKPGNQDIPGLNKFKTCALTGMNVAYAPDGQWAAYEDSQPVSLTMTLNFSEIEPIYESDYQEKNPLIKGNEGDNQPVYDGDVGY